MTNAWKRSLGDVFIEREYELDTNGKKTKVLLRFGKPRPTPGHEDYYCVYHIVGLGKSPHTSCGLAPLP